MRFGVLGSLSVLDDDGAEVRLAGPRQAKVLAALLLDANTLVPIGRLRAALWDRNEPATALRQVQDAVSGLRRRLGEGGRSPDLIDRRGQSFRINLDAGRLDLLAFEEAVRRAQALMAAGRRADAAPELRAALACWRGAALDGTPGEALAAAAAQLDARRFSARLQLMELDLEFGSGREAEVADEAAALSCDHPFDEQLARLWMLALYRTGRRADALAVHENLRIRLADELGVEPGPETAHLYGQVRSDSPRLARPIVELDSIAPLEFAAGPAGLNLLPADTRPFTGREVELEALLALVREAAQGGSPIVISAPGATVGIGKTALAVHAAHKIVEHFPDGQLFIDLQGHDRRTEPMPSATALGAVLRALGVPMHGIPPDENEQSAILRDRLAGTRTLLVLDNAAGTKQVRPLLPGAPGCLVLITSRLQLLGLDDAHVVELDLLSSAAATTLFHQVAGRERVPVGHPLVPELTELCGLTPLAIRIAAACLTFHKSLSLGELVAQLRDQHVRLSSSADAGRNLSALSAVLEVAYALLEPEEQRLLRLLGLVPGEDFDAYAAASLCGIDHRSARRLLDSLQGRGLVIQHRRDRFRLHNTVRDFVLRLLDMQPDELVETARDLLFDFYECAAFSVVSQRSADASGVARSTASAPVDAPDLSDAEVGLAWLRTERDNIVAAISFAKSSGRAIRAVNLTASLAHAYLVDGPWLSGCALHEAAADTARGHGDAVREADALSRAAGLRCRLADHAGAISLYSRGLELYEAVDELLGQERVLRALSRVHMELGDYARAESCIVRSLGIARELGDKDGVASCLLIRGGIGEVMDPESSMPLYAEALKVYRSIGDRLSEAQALQSLGSTELKLGRFAAAVSHFEQALPILEGAADRGPLALTLREQGTGLLAMGDFDAAHTAFERSLALCAEGHDDLGAAHARLSLGLLKQAAGDHTAAAEMIERVLRTLRRSGRPESIGGALVALSRSRRNLGDPTVARAHAREASALFVEAGDRHGMGWALVEVGAAAAREGAYTDALASYARAIEVAGGIGSLHCEARAREGSAECWRASGDHSTAIAALREAVELYRRCGAGETEAAAARLATWEA